MRRLLLSVIMLCVAQQAFSQFTATITAGGPTTFCLGSSVYLIANTNADAYQWILNGAPVAGANDDTLEVNSAGSYEVIVDSAGNTDTSLAEIVTVNTVPAQPGPISGPDTFCSGSLQTFSTAAVPGATGYIWWGLHSQMWAIDTTLLPTLTGYVTLQNLPNPSYIRVFALNACGVSQLSQTHSVPVGAPQIGGSWPFSDVDVSDKHIRICPSNTYTLFPVMHANPGGYTDPHTFQWYLDNIPVPGANSWEFNISRGGNYSVDIITNHCGTFTVPKKVYQDVPNSITVSPAGPLSFCTGNVTPLTVSFDMTGVSDPVTWSWVRSYANIPGGYNSYSILPDTNGSYSVVSYPAMPSNCRIESNIVTVTVPPTLEVIQTDDTLFATPGYSSYQWFESGAYIPGATSQSYVLTYDGVYSVEATYMNGCVETSDTFDSDYLLPQNGGGNEQEEEEQQQEQQQKEISVYPNPNIGAFTFSAKVPEENQTASVTITDIAGHVLFTKNATVTDGMIEEKIDFKDDIGRMCIIKVKAKGCNKTTTFLKQ